MKMTIRVRKNQERNVARLRLLHISCEIAQEDIRLKWTSNTIALRRTSSVEFSAKLQIFRLNAYVSS